MSQTFTLLKRLLTFTLQKSNDKSCNFLLSFSLFPKKQKVISCMAFHIKVVYFIFHEWDPQLKKISSILNFMNRPVVK